MWLLHEMGTAYGCRPSQLLSVDDPILAFMFDETVFVYGRQVNSLLDEVETDSKGKNTRKFALKDALRMAKHPESKKKGITQLMLESGIDELTL